PPVPAALRRSSERSASIRGALSRGARTCALRTIACVTGRPPGRLIRSTRRPATSAFDVCFARGEAGTARPRECAPLPFDGDGWRSLGSAGALRLPEDGDAEQEGIAREGRGDSRRGVRAGAGAERLGHGPEAAGSGDE